MKRLLIILFTLFLFVPQSIAANIVVEDFTPQQLRVSLMKFFIKQGARIDSATDYSLTVKVHNSGFLCNFLYGSRFNSYPEIRTFYSFVQDGKNTIVSANSMIVTNPNSSFETSVPLNDSAVQESLNNLLKAINRYYGYGISYKKHRKYLEITAVSQDCSAYRELNVNSRVYKINNNPIKGMSKAAVDSKLAAYDDKSEVVFYIIRANKNTEEITLKSKFIKPLITKENL